jgi:glycine betaine/proline transport system ATP-binding protein
MNRMNGTADARGGAVISCRNVWKVFGAQPKELAKKLAAQQEFTKGDGPVKSAKPVKEAFLSKEELLTSGSVVAVRDVSFDVFPGETFVVMGLSGSGKSTLLRCLPRLIEPTMGQVWVSGVEMTRADHKRLREMRRHKMSMVFQNFGLFPTAA